MRMGKKKKKKPFLWLAAGFFALLLVFSGFMLVRELVRAGNEEEVFETLAAARPRRQERNATNKDDPQSAETDTFAAAGEDHGTEDLPNANSSPSAEANPSESPTETNQVQTWILEENRRLHEMNPDFFAWIMIPDTNINYPVMYAPKQKDFYLSHDFYKNKASTGVPYLDEKCDPDGSYYLIFGHRPSVKTMFYHLVDYEERDFWEAHQLIYLDTLNEERAYVVVAAVKARVLNKYDREGFRYYSYKSLDNEDIFNEYMQKVRANQLYDTGMEAAFGDEILVLSTCYRYVKAGRFFVVAKRID